ncbi:sigma-70 family RNA polymerase sigma factor [Lentisphaera profundi]|uniref:Sigma-70 family RNA polymerase sigma factor n=1 Tax=Lentisphaera profundi TaxID=1658616 RepID=A0ABY7VRH2_9BACT|nr:sigma-70 family RNA polymerase sigma factor [Lentisphaera profundi]WDE95487.1 sigma-70 family RNA polymerase sigma factor [Lentisphaera profundi]
MSNERDPEFWVEEYSDYLFGFAYSRLNDVHKSEDVLQETFLSAVKSIEKYDGRVPIKFWLRGIMKYKILDSIKRDLKEIDLDSFPEVDSRVFKTMGIFSRKVVDWDFDPLQSFEKDEFWQIFRSCLEKVKDPLRAIYMMKEIDNVDTKTICDQFEISQANLWVITHRVRKSMKLCLNKNWGETYK